MCNDFGDARNNLLGGDSSILKREPKWDTEAQPADTAPNGFEL